MEKGTDVVMTKISFIIPCYGSESTIEDVVGDIKKTMLAHSESFDYEVVLVCDCSPDKVWDVIKKISEENPKMRGFCLAKNFGQHAALMAGYVKSTGDIIISLDDDGQTPASESMVLIEKINEGYDVVYGRYPERRDSSFRKFGTYLNNKMSESLIGKPRHIEVTGFFAARRYIIDEIVKYDKPYPYIWGLVFRTTSNIANADIQHEVRVTGKSGYTLNKLLSLWLNGFTSFSVKPLRIATVIGFVCAVIGFLLVIYTVVDRFMNPDMPAGYSALASMQLIIGGVLMIILGVIGEYLGRAYISLSKSPQYVIRDSVGDTPPERNVPVDTGG
jgi:undecaprenyl-phosphate 4-deoxy-4-formamido-L-arabinose transferase